MNNDETSKLPGGAKPVKTIEELLAEGTRTESGYVFDRAHTEAEQELFLRWMREHSHEFKGLTIETHQFDGKKSQLHTGRIAPGERAIAGYPRKP